MRTRLVSYLLAMIAETADTAFREEAKYEKEELLLTTLKIKTFNKMLEDSVNEMKEENEDCLEDDVDEWIVR